MSAATARQAVNKPQRPMSLELCILASGSAGNAAIVRSPAGVLLIDAGIGPRTLSKRLDGTGLHLAVSALCLTHLYGSHGVAGTRTVASRGKWSDSMAAAETASSVRRHPAGEQ